MIKAFGLVAIPFDELEFFFNFLECHLVMQNVPEDVAKQHVGHEDASIVDDRRPLKHDVYGLYSASAGTSMA
jgi:hypothetical protein